MAGRSRAGKAAIDEAAVETVEIIEDKKPIVAKDIDPNSYVTVRNGFHGPLNYTSTRTGEKFRWNEYGSDQDMELRELRNAKSSHKKFFINNWFMFDDPWVIDYLGVRNFYKYAIPIDSFDDIFTMAPDKLRVKISNLSKGQQRSVAYRAQELIKQRKIDSLSVIETLEDALGVELIER